MLIANNLSFERSGKYLFQNYRLHSVWTVWLWKYRDNQISMWMEWKYFPSTLCWLWGSHLFACRFFNWILWVIFLFKPANFVCLTLLPQNNFLNSSFDKLIYSLILRLWRLDLGFFTHLYLITIKRY